MTLYSEMFQNKVTDSVELKPYDHQGSRGQALYTLNSMTFTVNQSSSHIEAMADIRGVPGCRQSNSDVLRLIQLPAGSLIQLWLTL